MTRPDTEVCTKKLSVPVDPVYSEYPTVPPPSDLETMYALEEPKVQEDLFE